MQSRLHVAVSEVRWNEERRKNKTGGEMKERRGNKERNRKEKNKAGRETKERRCEKEPNRK